MEKCLTVKEASKFLNVSEGTVRKHLHEWGFFRMIGSRVWRIKESDLEKYKQQGNNDLQVVSVGRKKDKLCRSTKEKKAPSGGLILLRQAAAELDVLLKQQ